MGKAAAEGLLAQGVDGCERITLMVNLPIEYSDKPVTPFGGMALIKRFIDQTGIREHLAKLDLPLDQVWNIGNSRADCEPSAAR